VIHLGLVILGIAVRCVAINQPLLMRACLANFRLLLQPKIWPRAKFLSELEDSVPWRSRRLGSGAANLNQMWATVSLHVALMSLCQNRLPRGWSVISIQFCVGTAIAESDGVVANSGFGLLVNDPGFQVDWRQNTR
jgi:hypothetical protein